MAVIDYTQRGTRGPTTANNQNQMAQQPDWNRYPNPGQGSWNRNVQYSSTPSSSSPYTSPWGTPSAQRPPSGPYNPQGQAPGKVTNPSRTGPYNPDMPTGGWNPRGPQWPQQGPQSWPAPNNPTPYTPGRLDPWNPQVPERPQWNPYTPASTQTFPNPNNAAGAPWTPANFNTQALRDQYTAYMQATLPYQQFLQNQYQYGQDFNEAARRWDTQSQWQQQMDQYNMGLTGRQQQLAEWAQQEAANQWANQFGWQQQNDLFSQDLANRQFNQQDLELARRYGLDERELALRDTELARRYGLDERELDSLNAYRTRQLDQQDVELARRYGLDERQLNELVAYRNQQDTLARWTQQQQMAMQQAELEAQRQNAILQATGRAGAQAPNTQWMRRF